MRLPYFISMSIVSLCCAIFSMDAAAIQVSGVVTDGSTPIPGARVREHGSSNFVVTDSKGRFTLEIPGEQLQDFVIAAGKEGWINSGVMVDPKTSYTTIVMEKVPDEDDSKYDFITPHRSLVDLRTEPEELESLRMQSHTGFEEGCNLCHFEPTCYLCHRDLYKEWSTSQHAKGVDNPWTINLYDGTDAEGNENVGPGFRLDFPDDPGECADCHAPTAAVNSPGKTDLKVVYNRTIVAYPTEIGYKTLERAEYERKAGSVDGAGIHCDFCHKIQNVEVNEKAGVHGSITLHRVSMAEERERRRISGRLPPMFVYGPYDDVVNFSPIPGFEHTSPMIASYNPQFQSSDYCSACHQHKNEHGLPFMDTYREWKESPYSAMGIECQDCHMKPELGHSLGTFVDGDADKFWTPVSDRDASTVKPHDFPGATEKLLANAATLAIDAVASQGELTVTVNVRNVNTGHHIPSGITIRNMLLLVTPVLENGDTLRYTGEHRVPVYGGEGDLKEGNYAGYPGKGFALVFGDDEGNSHVMDWQATRIVEDTRIRARENDISVYTFEMPSDAARVDVHTDLIYRRAFKPLADLKKWTQKDMTVATDVTTLRPRNQTQASSPPQGPTFLARIRSYFD